MKLRHRTYSELASPDASGMGEQVAAQNRAVTDRLAGVGACVAVMSGKGGVGKSLVSAALAAAFARLGRATGLLDADLTGPSAARMSGLSAGQIPVSESGVTPPTSPAGVRVMSMDLLLEEGAPLTWHEPGSDSFVWRGTQERGALREFLADVAWGDLDVLLVDLPPGTQRLVDLHELVPALAGVVVVTVPSAASASAVERSISVAMSRGIPVLGIVENMSGYACVGCGQIRDLFPGDAGVRLAAEHGLSLLARLPFDPSSARHAETGAMTELLSETVTGEGLMSLARQLSEAIGVSGAGSNA